MINIGIECCGCTACCNVCPTGCIQMKENDEGFLYPIGDISKCIGCNQCEKVCPVIHEDEWAITNELLEGYVFQNRDREILKQSTSGGFFSALGKEIINDGGVVFGAAYDGKYVIHHVVVDNIGDLKKFRNSKYTQSNPENTFRLCKEYLKQGKLVLYSGTPCQIAGLQQYLGKKYNNLKTIDVVCHGVPSPKLFRKYVSWLGSPKKIKDIRFRDKYNSYYSSTMTIYYKDGKIRRRDKLGDPMLNFFFNDFCSRQSCYNCHFKTIDRNCDFTMFDSWHGYKYDHSFEDYGTTAVITRNKEAREIFDRISREHKSIRVNYNTLIKDDGSMMTNSVKMNPLRTSFFKDLNQISFDEMIKKYAGVTTKKKLTIQLKKILMKLGVWGKIMKARLE